MSEIKEVVSRLEKTVEDFKSTHAEELKQIKEKGVADPILTEKVAKINEEIGNLTSLKEQVEELEKKANRIHVSGKKQKSEDQLAHEKGFGSFLRKGLEDGLADLEKKALNVGTDADGGFAVPEALDSQIYALAQEVSPMRRLATVIRVGTSDYKQLINKHGAASGWVSETATRGDTATPKLGEFVPSQGEIYASPKATQRMLDDSFFNAESWLASEIATLFAEKEGNAFTAGDGINKPKGFLSYGTAATPDATRAYGTMQHVNSGDASSILSVDAFHDLIAITKSKHKNGAVFLANALTIAALRKLKDSTGQYLWQPSLIAGQPSTLLGYPIIENEDMPNLAANSLSIAFGNFKNAYVITDRIGIRVLRDPYTDKPYVSFYSTKRVGGGLRDSEAIKLIKTAA